MITKEEYEVLNKYAAYFKCVIENNYCSSLLRSDLETIASIVTKYKPNIRLNFNCMICKINLMKEGGYLLREYERNLPKEEIIEEPKKEKKNGKKNTKKTS